MEYNSVLPQLCKGCKGIFLTELSIEPLANCFICVTPMCPECFPIINDSHKGYAPVCLDYFDRYKSKEYTEISHTNIPLNSTLQDEDDFSDTINTTIRDTNSKPEVGPPKEKSSKCCKHYLMKRC